MAVDFVGRRKGWIVGFGGVILHTDNGGGIVGVEEESEKLELEVFPNPATSKANFRFQIPDYKSSNLSVFQSSISIKIYDVTGRLVREIPISNEILPPTFRRGQNDRLNVAWDLRDNSGKKVSSGVYFVRLRVEEQKSG